MPGKGFEIALGGIKPTDALIVGMFQAQQDQVGENAALVRATDGTWSVQGAGRVVVFVNGKEAGIDALPR